MAGGEETYDRWEITGPIEVADDVCENVRLRVEIPVGKRLPQYRRYVGQDIGRVTIMRARDIVKGTFWGGAAVKRDTVEEVALRAVDDVRLNTVGRIEWPVDRVILLRGGSGGKHRVSFFNTGMGAMGGVAGAVKAEVWRVSE